MGETTRTRMTAAERSAQVLEAAVEAFAESGYAATKTDEIARRAGVSQPYVIRLFGTKLQLFLACLHEVCSRIETVFRNAEIAPDSDTAEALRALGIGYETFLAERELPLVLLHGAAASADPAIGEHMRERFGRIYRLVGELTGADTEQSRRFVATGMLLTIMTAMQVAGTDAISLPWATEILDDIAAATEPC
ncbi:TetR family transcriptional regulator [Nocardia mangyaensis]|uniref:TetR family transcriptional regulator n=1 Tax=Nocardia mangyaensis TaxID=2213200 RepID=A0A1J0VQB2_9NOCA|nr:TetR/AcrR family transcriptional regulator [Nocardia mangyaensis]APE34220.1 TetR family transcriptional regulator [Nocardia mangyaensis]